MNPSSLSLFSDCSFAPYYRKCSVFWFVSPYTAFLFFSSILSHPFLFQTVVTWKSQEIINSLFLCELSRTSRDMIKSAGSIQRYSAYESKFTLDAPWKISGKTVLYGLLFTFHIFGVKHDIKFHIIKKVRIEISVRQNFLSCRNQCWKSNTVEIQGLSWPRYTNA